jgi:hypothetical protein
MRTRKVLGMFEPLIMVLILLCFVIGGLCIIKYGTTEVPIERAAETILHAEGIDVNFSKLAAEIEGTQPPAAKEVIP